MSQAMFWRKREQTSDASARQRVAEDKAITIFLEEVCRVQAPATVLLGVSGAVCQARFTEHGDGLLTLESVTDIAVNTTSSLTLCSVSVELAGRLCVFATALDAFLPPQHVHERPRLVLRRPTEVASADCRRTVRVPVYEETGVQVQLWVLDPRSVMRPTLIDVSMAGAGVRFPKGVDHHLAVGQACELRIRHAARLIKIRARVRHHTKTIVGLFFPDSLHGETIDAPEPVRELVRDLEAIWLKRRAA